MSLLNVGQLREVIKDLPDETQILGQVVGAAGTTVWNLQVNAGVSKYFKQTIKPLIIYLGHPELMKLPDWEDVK